MSSGSECLKLDGVAFQSFGTLTWNNLPRKVLNHTWGQRGVVVPLIAEILMECIQLEGILRTWG